MNEPTTEEVLRVARVDWVVTHMIGVSYAVLIATNMNPLNIITMVLVAIGMWGVTSNAKKVSIASQVIDDLKEEIANRKD